MNIQSQQGVSRRSFAFLVGVLAIVFSSMAMALSGPFAYVTNRNSNSVSVIDSSTGLVVDTVFAGIGVFPQYIAITPDGRFAWVGNAGSNDISVIETATNSVVDLIPVGRIPHAIDFTPDGMYAYITNKDDDNFMVVNVATRTVVKAVPLIYRPAGIKVAPDGSTAFATNELDRYAAPAVSIIDTASQSVTQNVSLRGGSSPLWFDITPDGRYLYIPERGYGDVAVFETAPVNAVVATIPTGSRPLGVAVHPEGTFAYVTNNGSGTVSVISTDTKSVVATISVGVQPVVPALSPDGGLLYVPNASDGTVSVVDTTTNNVTSTITVGTIPWGVAFRPLRYRCEGFEAPMDKGTVSVKKNRALPLKAKLIDEDGFEVTDRELMVPPVLQVLFTGPGQPALDVTDDAVPAGLGSDGNQFEFEVDYWRFNLKTKNWDAPGNYSIRMVAGDSYLIDPTCQASFNIK